MTKPTKVPTVQEAAVQEAIAQFLKTNTPVVVEPQPEPKRLTAQ